MSAEQPTPETHPLSASEAGTPADAPATPTPAETDAAATPAGAGRGAKPTRTRVSAAWVASVAGIVVMVLLLIFILENTEQVKINFLGASGKLGLGVALFAAAVGGALIVAILGVARMAQLRRRLGPRGAKHGR